MKTIEVSEFLYDRLKELQKKYEYDNVNDLVEYILDKAVFLEYE